MRSRLPRKRRRRSIVVQGVDVFLLTRALICRGGLDEGQNVEHSIEQLALFDVGAQREMARRQMPPVAVAFRFFGRDQHNAEPIGVLLEEPRTVRGGHMAHHVKRVLQSVGQLVHGRKHLEERFASLRIVGRKPREAAREPNLERREQLLEQVEIHGLDERTVDELLDGLGHYPTRLRAIGTTKMGEHG